MKPLAKILTLSLAVTTASAQQIRDAVLDERTVITVPVSANRVTTISFPSAISALDGAMLTTDGKTPALFQIAHTKGTAYFSARALAKDAATNVNVRWNNRTYVVELTESADPCLLLTLRSRDESTAKPRPLTPNRLIGLLDKAKAFPLLQLHKPDAIRDVELRDPNAPQMISDCGDYEIRCEQALRFPEADALVFRLVVKNKTAHAISHISEKLEVRVGNQVLTPAIADLSADLAPMGEVTGFIAVNCGTNAGLHALSLKNEFRFNLTRREELSLLPALNELAAPSK